MAEPRPAASRTLDEMIAWLDAEHAAGRTGRARKTRPVDARPARAGEVVVTVILGEGEETRNTAGEGDWVVRNRCPQTGNEEYLVAAAKFAGKYEEAGAPDADGWRECRPLGDAVRFAFVRPEDGSFSFTAPWGEAVAARPGDAIVQSPQDAKDVYRVARASFECTYEIE
jgi:hypothetical protein